MLKFMNFDGVARPIVAGMLRIIGAIPAFWEAVKPLWHNHTS